jgi:hypothetical protein
MMSNETEREAATALEEFLYALSHADEEQRDEMAGEFGLGLPLEVEDVRGMEQAGFTEAGVVATINGTRFTILVKQYHGWT